MDDEVEDIVGDVKYTDSQKSVTTSAVNSLDFTDSSSPDRNNSSGKETYIIDCDDTDDSENIFRIREDEVIIKANPRAKSPDIAKNVKLPKYNQRQTIDRSIRTNVHSHSTSAHESFTQTSKTIFELAQNEIIFVHKPTERKTLETQTSFLSVIENKTNVIENKMEYNIIENKMEYNVIDRNYTYKNIEFNTQNEHMEKISNKSKICTPTIQSPDKNTEKEILTLENRTEVTTITKLQSDDDNIIVFIDDEAKESEEQKELQYETSEFESSKYDSNIEDDSLKEYEYRGSKMSKGDNASDTSEMQKSFDTDLDELYSKLVETSTSFSPETSIEPCVRKFGAFTPLTEETSQRKASILDLTPSAETLMEPTKDTDDTVLVNNRGIKTNMFPHAASSGDSDNLKLPPINRDKSGPISPHLNFLFSVSACPRALGTAGTLPCLYEGQNEFDRWEINAKELASGESPLISGRSDPVNTSKGIHLPPIHVEGSVYNDTRKSTNLVSPTVKKAPTENSLNNISINGRIKELKMMINNRTRSKLVCRSCSPTSMSSREESKTYDATERGCDNLCVEMLRRLRSQSWVEVTETLDDIPRSLEKYWPVIAVTRIADLLRQVILHVDSPRSQVARTACATLAEILKCTNYTRKPNFYESISILLTKTGSFSRPVRRAANIALDEIVSSVDVTHSVTAVCVYGVGHKSALVRSASARLLVVCCALAEGGRQVLRGRPPSAAVARRHVLRALAELLQDKSVDTRKYAERLYSILRPLPTFEAYFLTDVDVELAARHMKKYDHILLNTKQAR